MNSTILAVDLGQFNSTLCRNQPGTRRLKTVYAPWDWIDQTNETAEAFFTWYREQRVGP